MHGLRLLGTVRIRHVSSRGCLASRQHDGLTLRRAVLAHRMAHGRSHGVLHWVVDDDRPSSVADVSLVASKDEKKYVDSTESY